MRAYSQNDEDNVRDQVLVEDLIRSGLLNAEQDQRIQPELTVTLRRIHWALRAVLALFTTVLVIASIALTVNLLNIPSRMGPPIFGLWAVFCLLGAWLAARKLRLYRCGFEEALAVMAVAFFVGAVTWNVGSGIRDQAGVAAGIVGSLGIYGLFRFRYALIAGGLLTGLVPFTLHTQPVTARIISLSILSVLFFCAWRIQRRSPVGNPDGDWTALQATAFAAFYLVLNLKITTPATDLVGIGSASVSLGPFYWITYVVAWIVPAAGLWLGIRDRVRLIMDVSGLAFLATILTNKSYLGWPHQTWDPALLGAVLIIAAVVLRRWLASNGGAFTPLRLLESENRASSAATALSLAVPQNLSPDVADTRSFKGEGGQSGGGGASGSY